MMTSASTPLPRALVALAATLCLLGAPCRAEPSDVPGPTAGNGVRFSGFGTLGVAHTHAPEGLHFLRTIDESPGSGNTRMDVDSRLGVQINMALTPQIELVGQLLAARRLPDAPSSDALEWAFVAWRPNAEWALRAGRLNLDQFVMSDYRNVGFAYLQVRPPVEYYGTIPSHLDGLDVTRTWTVDDARWRVKGFAGNSTTAGVPIRDGYGISVTREAGGLLLRAGMTKARLTGNPEPLVQLMAALQPLKALPIPSVAADAEALRASIDMTNGSLTYATLGASYEYGAWTAAAEATHIRMSASRVEAGYLSVGRRFGPVTAYGVISGATDLAADVQPPAWSEVLTPVLGPAAAQQAQALGTMAAFVARQTIRQSTFSLGARWDIHPRVALKAQWDRVRIKQDGGHLWQDVTGQPARATVTSVNLDFIF